MSEKPEERAQRVLIEHQRLGIGDCGCGRWRKLGSSFALHVIDELKAAGLSIEDAK